MSTGKGVYSNLDVVFRKSPACRRQVFRTSQRSYPNISEANGIAVILKFDWQGIRMRFVIRDSNVFGWTFEDHVILHQDPINQHRNSGR